MKTKMTTDGQNDVNDEEKKADNKNHAFDSEDDDDACQKIEISDM